VNPSTERRTDDAASATATEPWLSGLVACPLTADAEAVRAILHARGLKTRSIPSGRAKGAWTCVTDRGTLAVVVGGMGQDANRDAASFWMPRARWLVLVTAGPGTGTTEPGTVVLDGDRELAVLAARGAPQGTTATAKIAGVAEPVLGPASRATLADQGYAAWDPNVDAWRQAAAAVSGAALVCQGITTVDPERDRDLLRDVPDGATGRPWWQTALALINPSTRRRQKASDKRHADAVNAAARCAVAALLGPPQT
jgi:hypothetical protein